MIGMYTASEAIAFPRFTVNELMQLYCNDYVFRAFVTKIVVRELEDRQEDGDQELARKDAEILRLRAALERCTERHICDRCRHIACTVRHESPEECGLFEEVEP